MSGIRTAGRSLLPGALVVCLSVLVAACSGGAAEPADADPSTAALAPASQGPLVGPSVAASQEPSGARSPSVAPPSVAGPPETADPTPPAAQPTVLPPEGEGDLRPVPTVARSTARPVPLEQPLLLDDLEVSVTGVRRVEVEARGPGEVGGEAVAVDLRVVNEGASPVDLPGLAVSLAVGGTEGGPLSGPPAEPLRAGRLRSGEAVAGTYVFSSPDPDVDIVLVRVSSASSQVVAQFRGSVTD